VLAGYVGIPEAIMHGGNRLEAFLAPSFQAPGAVETATEVAGNALSSGTEFGLMGVSVLAAFGGIVVAYFFFLAGGGSRAESMARQLSGLYRLLLGKYYVDEIYDAAIVQPIKRTSTVLLWRGVDAGLIDGTVNAVGWAVRAWSAVLRRLQTGSVRAYAMSLFIGVVTIVGYYLWR
jgi:NADH-quinone oxidoreductase subunit L